MISFDKLNLLKKWHLETRVKVNNYDNNSIEGRIFSIFEAYKAHHLLEQLDGKPKIRAHVYRKLQFNIARNEYDYLKVIGVDFMILEP